jgi:adenylate cyclase
MASFSIGFRPWAEKRAGILANVVLSLLLAALGWAAVQWRDLIWPTYNGQRIDWTEMGLDPLQQLSFDVPFVVRHSLPGWLRLLAGPPRPTDEVALLYMDEESSRRLEQPPDRPWGRSVHARLLDKLTDEGARAVVFDVVFDTESTDDPIFAAALARNGQAFLGATFSTSGDAPLTFDELERLRLPGISGEQLTRRNKLLYQAARGWGLLTFRPVESDHGVRRLFTGKAREGFPTWPSISWQVAQTLGAKLSEDPAPRFAPRWINFYGPARRIESISYFRALVPEEAMPAGYFRNRIVFVGARSQLDTGSRRLLDEFSTPWSWLRGRTYMPGAEIHATALLNLLHNDWQERVPFPVEKWFVVLLGLALGALRWLRPWRAIIVTVIGAFAVVAMACLMQWHAHLWWNWAVPVMVQMPLGVGLAVSSRYYLEERRKRKLRSAFGFYLSPDLASEIAERDFTLAPGGEKVLATMVFTDLEGFTTLSEKLGDSARLGEVLTGYFTRTTDEILAEKGTVIKFIGDAVFAAWGAPLPQADQAERAVRAAWKLSQVSEMDVPIPQADGTTVNVHVRTRIGIHTGEALAGNLGSARRFDYTLIGDAVNFAARLEGANKYTGTAILLSDDTAQRLNGKFLLRRLGAFKVKGKGRFVVIHELLGDDPAARPPWLDTFDAALGAWFAGDFAAAKVGFESVKAARGGKDGPSQFYLDRVDDAIMTPGWTGEVELEGK